MSITVGGETSTASYAAGVGTLNLTGLITADGTTATLTTAAGEGTPSLVTGAYLVPGVTAVMVWEAGRADVALSASAIVVEGDTSYVDYDAGTCVPIIGTVVQGDLEIAPLLIGGLSGAQTLGFAAFTEQRTEHAYTAEAFLLYTPPAAGLLSLTVPASTEVWVRDFNDDTDVYEQSYAPGTWSILVSGALMIMWAGSSPTVATLSWAFESVTEPIQVSVYPAVVSQTPTTVRVWATGADEEEAVYFYVPGYYSSGSWVVADETGAISGSTIPLPALPVGSATIVAQTDNGIGSASIAIINPAPTYPTTDPGDADPALLPQTGVVKWILFDPAPSGELYTFPFNPATWTSPHAPRTYTAETFSHGKPIIWEAGIRSHQFQFSGYSSTEAQYEAMERFRDLNHRFWLVDHRNRAWAVTIDQIEWRPKRVQGVPWAYEYTVKAQVYQGPVTLSG